jgi:predicted O-methyltransferase YrrM
MYFTDSKAQAVFERYRARHEDELAQAADLPRESFGASRDELLLPVGAAAGDFLRALAVGREAQLLLELGTSYGYSTLFLADAARETGGKVITMDVDARKQAYAREQLAEAGLEGFVEFRCGDAVEMVRRAGETFDFALLDIWKDLYVACFEALYPKLAQGGIMASDNMIYPAGAREATRALRAAIKAKPDLQTALLQVGSGIELTVRWSADSPML